MKMAYKSEGANVIHVKHGIPVVEIVEVVLKQHTDMTDVINED